jgi:hypothetical protein|tara:strand:- start:296 stop:547 length:252 start_codon:yes stop_codon:yes gene_type:complete
MFFLLIFPLLFGVVNADALDTFQKEMDAGATWHHVGKQPLDPNAKSIPLQTCDDNGVCEEPYIVYKLKYPDLPGDTPVDTDEK